MKSKIVSSRLLAFCVALAPLALAAMPNGCGGASNDTATPNDSPDASTCDKHLAPGFTNVSAVPATDTHAGYYGMQPSMALDENDDPMFAYFNGEDGAVYPLYFTRWDPCVGAFTTPLLIDAIPNGTSTGAAERNVQIGYDLSTKEIGIVYNQASVGNGPGDGNPYVSLATEKAGQTTFTTQAVSPGLSSVVGTSNPAIAMAGGQIYIAYAQGNYNCGNGPSCQGLQLLTSTAKETDGGFDPDGGAQPHYFSDQAIPSDAAPIQARNDSLSLAIDSSGKVGVAFFQEPQNYNTTLMFWRAGMANAASVTDTENVQNDGVAVSLAFEGTKPRIVARMTRGASPPSYLLYSTSDDGVKWASPVDVAEDNGASNAGATVALALDGTGHGIVTADVNGGPATCTDPYLAQTSNDGATWTACVSDIAKGDSFTLSTVSAAYGQSRNKGKFIFSFQNSNSDMVAAFPNGVWLYQSP